MSDRWSDIFKHLDGEQVNVFSPSTHEGVCSENYVVVKKEGGVKHSSFSTNIDYYSILIYVPEHEYSKLDGYVNSIKEIMKGLKPMINAVGTETPSFHDKEIKAHMVSLMYQNYKKI